MTQPLIDTLVQLLSAGQVVTGDAALAFARDHSDGTAAGVPAAVVFPRSTAEVAAAVTAAAEHGVPVVAQGGRSGLAGGANAVDGALLVNTGRMTRILEVSAADQVATVEAGVLTIDLAEAVAAQGLFYPPDPGSWAISTIGGNIATNAGGMRCVKYGVTGNFVRQLTVVLPSGDVARMGHRTVKGVTGLDLTALMVGSEGTLGIITEATLALLPQPGEPVGVLATFAEASEALAAADAIMASPRRPSILEFLDGRCVRAINAYDPASTLPPGTNAVLLLQSDDPGRAGDDADEYAAIARRCGATTVDRADDAAAVDALMGARRQLHGALRAVAGASLNEDVAVSRSQLPALLAGIEQIERELGVTIAVGGHLGDGNLHPVVCYDPDDEAAALLAVTTYQRVIALAISLGGTGSGEHGIGTLKREHLDAELGPVLRSVQLDVKRALDPAGRFNPGTKL